MVLYVILFHSYLIGNFGAHDNLDQHLHIHTLARARNESDIEEGSEGIL